MLVHFKYVALLALTTLTASNLLAQTCDTAGAGDLYADQDWYVSNSPAGTADGRYPADGGTGPFQTVQQLIDAMSPGDCGFIRASSSPYVELGRKSGTDYSGNTFLTGGASEDQRVIISGYPGERPTISSNLSYDASNRPVTGFFIFGGNYITIRNLEITSTTGPGVFTHPQEINTDIVVENNYIHHIYGKENIGGVRIDHCVRCVVRGNTIHDIYDTRTHATTSNPITSEPYGMHSGVHGYFPQDSVIEHNHIYNVGKAIYQKEPNRVDAASNVVRYNIIENISDAAFYMQNMGSNGSPAIGAKFHHNLVRNAPIGVWAEYYEATSPSEDFEINNNTLINVNSLVMLQKVRDVEIFNNLIHSTDFHVGTQAVIILTNTQTADLNQIAYSDHNLFFDVGNFALVDRYTSDNAVYDSLAGWQSASSTTSDIVGTRETNSLVQEPSFEDPTSMNYRLVDNSPGDGDGRYGGDIGAFGNGFSIGPADWFLKPKFGAVIKSVN